MHSIFMKLKLDKPTTDWVEECVFDSLEDDEEITLFETTHTPEYSTVYIKIKAYHKPTWIPTLIQDHLFKDERIIEVIYK